MSVCRVTFVQLVIPLLATTAAAAAEAPVNFVLVMCDDLGWGDTGFNGNNTIRTPHLDEMAKAGLKFTRFYAASAVCSPTRGSVVTGRHPYRYGVPTANAGHLREQEWTLAELLRARGYRTGHFGKWHLGTLSKTVRESNRGGPKNSEHYSPPWKNGFDTCFSTEAKTPTYDPMWKPKRAAAGRGWDYLPDTSAAAPYGTHYWTEGGEIVKDNLQGDDSRVIMDRAAPFILDSIAAGKPFFAVIWFHTPHLPVVAGPEHAAMYAQYESYPKNYYGCITAMDEQMGRLRRTLRDAGVANQTLLTFCSDNGPEGNQLAPGSSGPFRGRKRDLYEGGVRVPGLIEWPAGIKPGRVTDYPAVTSDYLPTILELLGVPSPDDRPLDGHSLLPVFRSDRKQRPRPIGFEFGGKLAWSDNRYKLVFQPERGKADSQGKKRRRREVSAPAMDEFQLYDLLEDPGERRDVARRNPQLVEKMAGELAAWRSSCRRSAAGADYTVD